MKYIFFIILACSFVSCEKEHVETGKIIVNFSFNISNVTVGVFDAVHYSSDFRIDPRLALKSQKVTGKQLIYNELLSGNYIVVVIEQTAYLKAAQVQPHKTTEIFF